MTGRPDPAAAPLTPAQGVTLAASTLLVLGSGLLITWTMPGLPARVPLHWGRAGVPDRFGPPSDLWIIWGVMAAVWLLLSVLALRPPQNRTRLNPLLPPITGPSAARVSAELRTTLLTLGLLLTLVVDALLTAGIVAALGGPNLSWLGLLALLLVPAGVGWALFRLSRASRIEG